jgi:hypothetical protein
MPLNKQLAIEAAAGLFLFTCLMCHAAESPSPIGTSYVCWLGCSAACAVTCVSFQSQNHIIHIHKHHKI